MYDPKGRRIIQKKRKTDDYSQINSRFKLEVLIVLMGQGHYQRYYLKNYNKRDVAKTVK